MLLFLRKILNAFVLMNTDVYYLDISRWNVGSVNLANLGNDESISFVMVIENVLNKMVIVRAMKAA